MAGCNSTEGGLNFMQFEIEEVLGDLVGTSQWKGAPQIHQVWAECKVEFPGGRHLALSALWVLWGSPERFLVSTLLTGLRFLAAPKALPCSMDSRSIIIRCQLQTSESILGPRQTYAVAHGSSHVRPLRRPLGARPAGWSLDHRDAQVHCCSGPARTQL